ncbi:MAG TPA: tyrosine--tRNA ligase [Candidatus Acidoferrales bacterium]|nr:tyrosine--tRNA ligase [Candidatus Acidoferrales bacterium]
MPVMTDFLAELRWRGMLQEMTDGLEARLSRGPISAYVGFDPTGDSLHAGHLIPVFGLLHLQRAGGTPVAVVGGGTGMIGDPSGRSAERNLLDEEELAANVAAMRLQLGQFLDFSPGLRAARMVDNREWLGRYGLIEYLREIGKHFTLGYMLDKDSVQLRMGAGISFTEFSYMTLQATDFLHLYRDHGVELQMGGADQFGNITAGLELIRRVHGTAPDGGPRAFGLSFPLLTAPSGRKFGKSEGGQTVFLAAHRTSPYDFYQYWLNSDDRDVPLYLRTLTLLERDAVEALEADQAAHPEDRPAQRALAFDLTARVHGTVEAALQRHVSEVAFSGEPLTDPDVLQVLHDHAGGFEFGPGAATAFDVALASGLFASRGDLRRSIAQGGVTVDGTRVPDAESPAGLPVAGTYHVVRHGRRRLAVGSLRS